MRRFNGVLVQKTEFSSQLGCRCLRLLKIRRPHYGRHSGTFTAPDGQKLGIGSSAAVAVGTSVFLRQQLDSFALESALDGHRKASNGIGSGVDLASVFHGGVIATSVQPSAIEQLSSFFEDLHLAVFYLEKSASTKSMVSRCQRSEQWQSPTNEMTSVSRAD